MRYSDLVERDSPSYWQAHGDSTDNASGLGGPLKVRKNWPIILAPGSPPVSLTSITRGNI
jgi:hypothetical protein